MSFLLSKPTKRSETGGGLARLQQRGTAGLPLTTNDTKIIPTGKNSTVDSQGGSQFFSKQPMPRAHASRQASSSSVSSRMIASGNQVMLQRQKPKTQQKPIVPQQQRQKWSKQDQDSLGVISMEEGESQSSFSLDRAMLQRLTF
jgi:hypothetical protein